MVDRPLLEYGDRSVLTEKDQVMVPPPCDQRLKWLEANADKPEVQELIRQEIVRGTVRVIPGPGETIRIIPLRPGAGPGQPGAAP
jgi:hypothetical protein